MFEDSIMDNSYCNYYTVKKGDTLYNISLTYNINPYLLAALNGLNIEDYIYKDQQLMIPKSEYSYYITDSGDTLDEVSKIFNVSQKDLLNQNKTIYLMDGQLFVNKKNK